MDKISSSEQSSANAASARAQQKRKEIEDLENQLIKEKALKESERTRILSDVNAKTQDQMVQISKEGEDRAEMLRNLQKARVMDMNANTQKQMEDLSKITADRIKALDDNARGQILKVQLGNMEKISSASEKSTDPFYRLKTFDATVAEDETGYTVKVKLPPHEAKNLFVTSEGKNVKLSLSRRYGEEVESEPNRKTTTKTHQSIQEVFTLTQKPDLKNMARTYDGTTVTMRLGKS